MRNSPTTTVLRVAVAAGLVVAGSVGVDVAATGASTPSGSSASALFRQNLLGVSRFTQRGSTVTVNGLYARLSPGNSYFTVVYANTNCDPAQAFPAGPFTAGRNGVARFGTTLTAPTPALVAGTQSMSVRMADTAADLDQDGKTGPTDVVAVPGQPAIGLVECNSRPWVDSRG